MTITKNTDRGVKCSLTPGHEIAGTIESVEGEAEGFEKDDKVLVFPWMVKNFAMHVEKGMRTSVISLDF